MVSTMYGIVALLPTGKKEVPSSFDHRDFPRQSVAVLVGYWVRDLVEVLHDLPPFGAETAAEECIPSDVTLFVKSILNWCVGILVWEVRLKSIGVVIP